MLPKLLRQNVLRDGTFEVSSTDGDSSYHKDNMLDYKSYTKWKAGNTSDPWIEITLGSAVNVDCLGIYNHNLDEVGGNIYLQYYDSGWITIEEIIPDGKYPIMIAFDVVNSDNFRLFFDTPTLEPEIAVMFLGKAMEFPFPPDSPVTPLVESVQANVEFSQAGHLLGSIISHHPLTANYKWSNIDRTWFESDYRPFWDDHAKWLIPFFFCWDITNRPYDVIYGIIDPGMNFTEVLTIYSLEDSIELRLRAVSSDRNYSPLNES